MDVRARWLGRLIPGGALEPGNLFVAGAEEDYFLGLRVLPSMGATDTIVLAARVGEPSSTPSARRYDPDHYSGEQVRLIEGDLVLAPAQAEAAFALGAPGTERDGWFELTTSGEIAFAFLSQGYRCQYELKTGRQIDDRRSLRLPVQRLLWIDGDATLELCRY